MLPPPAATAEATPPSAAGDSVGPSTVTTVRGLVARVEVSSTTSKSTSTSLSQPQKSSSLSTPVEPLTPIRTFSVSRSRTTSCSMSWTWAPPRSRTASSPAVMPGWSRPVTWTRTVLGAVTSSSSGQDGGMPAG